MEYLIGGNRCQAFLSLDRAFFVALRFASRAATAFFALACLSSGVIVSSDRFPPIAPPSDPPILPCSRKNSSASGGR